jgi:CDP-glycerol glycerophosphotransferase
VSLVASSRHPLLSVVVPVYRVEEYLPRCLDSILDGTGGEVEIVAVDDHSPDSSGKIIDEYARRDPRVRAVHLAANVGLGRARNAGLDRTRGGYVWFVDSDDWLPPGSVAAVLARLAATRPDVLLVDHADVFPGDLMRETGSGPVLREASAAAPVRVGERPELLGLSLGTSACTKVIRRALLDEIDLRFPPGWYEDCAFAYPLLLEAERIDALEQVCYYYRHRPAGAITKSVSGRHFDVFDQYERMWARVAKAAPEHDALRPELFRLMVDHLLVIAGNDHRLPRARRREFFGRIVQEYRRQMPDGGYEPPGGLAGLKHRLVRRNAYSAYAALRLARQVLPARRRGWAELGVLSRVPVGRPGGVTSELGIPQKLT